MTTANVKVEKMGHKKRSWGKWLVLPTLFFLLIGLKWCGGDDVVPPKKVEKNTKEEELVNFLALAEKEIEDLRKKLEECQPPEVVKKVDVPQKTIVVPDSGTWKKYYRKTKGPVATRKKTSPVAKKEKKVEVVEPPASKGFFAGLVIRDDEEEEEVEEKLIIFEPKCKAQISASGMLIPEGSRENPATGGTTKVGC